MLIIFLKLERITIITITKHELMQAFVKNWWGLPISLTSTQDQIRFYYH